MSAHSLDVVILAAGQGTRMRSRMPKVLHAVAGRSMLGHVLAAAHDLSARRIVTVVGPDMAEVAAAAAPHPTVVQAERRGTAHAVAQALPLLADDPADTVLVLYGDVPLTRAETLTRLIGARGDAAAAVLGFVPADPRGYGRLVLAAGDRLAAIVEEKDASEAERMIALCNAGIMALDGRALPTLADLEALGCDNAQQEYYLTGVVARARQLGRDARAVIVGDPAEALGVNSRADLAAAEAAFQARARAAAMAAGATLIDPASVHFSYDTQLGRDVVIGPHVVLGPGVIVEDGAEIRAFCHIEGARVRQNAVVGPFARLRPGAEIGADAHVGNFVEIKNAMLGPAAKVNHLSYVGDAEIGAGANVGAGTITCNYDGFAKHRTEVGPGAFIGSNTALVAPVVVGAGAIIGAGSTITADVPPEALALARATQATAPQGAARFRAKRRKELAEEG